MRGLFCSILPSASAVSCVNTPYQLSPERSPISVIVDRQCGDGKAKYVIIWAWEPIKDFSQKQLIYDCWLKNTSFHDQKSCVKVPLKFSTYGVEGITLYLGCMRVTKNHFSTQHRCLWNIFQFWEMGPWDKHPLDSDHTVLEHF